MAVGEFGDSGGQDQTRVKRFGARLVNRVTNLWAKRHSRYGRPSPRARTWSVTGPSNLFEGVRNGRVRFLESPAESPELFAGHVVPTTSFSDRPQ